MTDPNPENELRNYRPTRPQHRAKSHDDAHNDADLHDPGISQTNPLVHRGEPTLIETQSALLELIARLRATGSFAYDSEFIGELTYLPQLCVVQVASPQEVALIDPMVPEIDLIPFWELLADESVQKITHAGQQDLEPVMRHLNRPARNVFDCQIAAGFAGMAYPVSLSKLVLETVGARLGKGLTFSHWDQRPLSSQQIRYAANDVRYLCAVHAVLRARLQANGHLAWAMEECAAQSGVGLYRFDPETSFLKVRGAGSLTAVGLAVLKELTLWRDAAARQHDVPPRAFLKDEILIDLSRNPVKSVDKLNRVRGLPRPVEQAHGARIVDATRRGLAQPIQPEQAERFTEESPTDKHRADALWAMTQCLCIGMAIDPDLVTSRQDIGRLHRQIRTGQAPRDLRMLTGWRYEAVTHTLLEILRGTATLNLAWDADGLAATPAGQVNQ